MLLKFKIFFKILINNKLYCNIRIYIVILNIKKKTNRFLNLLNNRREEVLTITR
jgi:hypothetical protein